MIRGEPSQTWNGWLAVPKKETGCTKLLNAGMTGESKKITIRKVDTPDNPLRSPTQYNNPA
jgi:hypothetical protein